MLFLKDMATPRIKSKLSSFIIFFEIECKSNSNGSRNLEYDKSKDITKQYIK